MSNQRALAIFHLSLTALFSAVAFCAVPPYRIGLLGSALNLALACLVMKQWKQRKVLGCTFVGVVAVAALASYFRQPSGRMYDLGVLVLVLMLVVSTAVAFSVYAEEKAAA